MKKISVVAPISPPRPEETGLRLRTMGVNALPWRLNEKISGRGSYHPTQRGEESFHRRKDDGGGVNGLDPN